MASSIKKPRMSEEKSFFDDDFLMEPVTQKLQQAFEKLCMSPMGGLGSLTLKKCNADYGSGEVGKPFSKADVEVIQNIGDTHFYFGTIFLSGFEMLESYFDDPKSTPFENRPLLSRLFAFLLDKGKDEALKSIEKHVIMECDMAVRFAEHFFKKLSESCTYALDQNYPNNSLFQECQCGCHTDVRSHYGDTSIGNSKVWHGCLDIILGSYSVPVTVIEDEQEPDSPGEKSTIEVKVTNDLEEADVTSQLLAQTIVFSFAQKKKHPELNNFLIPSIGVNSSNIIFYFYDSEHDILLKSMAFRFFEFDRKQVSYIAILATWFVVNYKSLCSGCTEEILNAKKANFFKLAGCQLPVYQNELSIGGIKHEKQPKVHFEPAHITGLKFGKSPRELLRSKPLKRK